MIKSMVLLCSFLHLSKKYAFSYLSPHRFLFTSTRYDHLRTSSIHNMDFITPTPYTITCPPTERHILQDLSHHHVQNKLLYQQKKPIAAHTMEAFQRVKHFILEMNPVQGVILDSGCGTGKSTLTLAKMYPQHVIVGIDRSLPRLTRNVFFRKQQQQQQVIKFFSIRGGGDDDEETDDEYDDDIDVENIQSISHRTRILKEYPNVILVRADLVDFWICYLRHSSHLPPISHHYLLYPNPYPKVSRLKNRWYAHPSFPILFELGGDMIIRSNWKQYLEEWNVCAQDTYRGLVVVHNNNHHHHHEEESSSRMETNLQFGQVQRIPTLVSDFEPMTNFEKKYVDMGEPIYELRLCYS